MMMDAVDRTIINRLQEGFPIVECPYADVAAELDLDETELLARLQALLAEGVLSRFGPMFHAEALGGGLSLVAMQVPAEHLERVIVELNALPEVAHNYERDHRFNLWFVLATEHPEQIEQMLRAIEDRTGYATYNFPKQEEYFLNLRLPA